MIWHIPLLGGRAWVTVWHLWLGGIRPWKEIAAAVDVQLDPKLSWSESVRAPAKSSSEKAVQCLH